MKAIQRLNFWADNHRDTIWDMVRIYLGIGLFIKGMFFMFNRDELLKIVDGAGALWWAPMTIAHYVICAHILGGFLLAIGLVTRLAALVQVPILIFAVFYLYMPKMMLLEPRLNLEFAGLVLFLLVLFSIFGAGRWSLDNYLNDRLRRDMAAGHHQPSPAH